MNSIKLVLAATTAALLAGPALAHDCIGRIGEFERLLDEAAEEAISASSGGQAVAGAREAQAMKDGEEDPVPFQEEPGAEEAVEEAEEAGEGGAQIIDARTALEEARNLAEDGGEKACLEALDAVIVSMIAS